MGGIVLLFVKIWDAYLAEVWRAVGALVATAALKLPHGCCMTGTLL